MFFISVIPSNSLNLKLNSKPIKSLFFNKQIVQDNHRYEEVFSKDKTFLHLYLDVMKGVSSVRTLKQASESLQVENSYHLPLSG